MESILQSVKKTLGLDADYDVFDPDVIMHINTTFGTLQDLGIGPESGFMIEDATATWDSYVLGDNRILSVKSYVYLRVRMLFDPPTSSYHVAAIQEQIKELEWRLNVHHEKTGWIDPMPIPVEE